MCRLDHDLTDEFGFKSSVVGRLERAKATVESLILVGEPGLHGVTDRVVTSSFGSQLKQLWNSNSKKDPHFLYRFNGHRSFTTQRLYTLNLYLVGALIYFWLSNPIWK